MVWFGSNSAAASTGQAAEEAETPSAGAVVGGVSPQAVAESVESSHQVREISSQVSCESEIRVQTVTVNSEIEVISSQSISHVENVVTQAPSETEGSPQIITEKVEKISPKTTGEVELISAVSTMAEVESEALLNLEQALDLARSLQQLAVDTRKKETETQIFDNFSTGGIVIMSWHFGNI